jgi:hypothetical protein
LGKKYKHSIVYITSVIKWKFGSKNILLKAIEDIVICDTIWMINNSSNDNKKYI